MEYIVNLSPEINARNRNGDTPLSLAVQRNIRKAGEFLLGRGADIFSANNDNYSPLRMVLEDTRNTRSWFLTSQVIKATDGSGNTPLHYAAEWAQSDAVMLLVEKGADPNTKNANGETPLYNAVKANNTDIISQLLANGAQKETIRILFPNSLPTAPRKTHGIIWAIHRFMPVSGGTRLKPQ